MVEITNNKRFSILIPVYNRDIYVKYCIDSVFSQTFKDFEIIVIDDGSTDLTPEVLKSYKERIITLSQKNQGPDVARNLGASQASGEYLVFLDSDDLLLPWALATYDRIIHEFESPALIIGVLKWFIDGVDVEADIGTNAVIEVFKYRDYLAKDISVGLSCSNIIVKSSIFRQSGGHRQTTPETFHADEHDIILRLGTYGPCVIMQKPATVAYRCHKDNTIRDIKRMVNGTLSLSRAERLGQYPGGQQRRVERYSLIGGMAKCWIWSALLAHYPLQALKLLICTFPMITMAALNALCHLFRLRTPSIILNEQRRD